MSIFRSIALFCTLSCLFLYGFTFDLSTPCFAVFTQDGQTVETVWKDGKPGLKMSWDGARHAWYEIGWTNASRQPKFTAFTKLKGKIQFTCNSGVKPNAMNIRFADAGKEIFGYHCTVSIDGKGQGVATFEVDPKAKTGSWVNHPEKETKDGKLDLPATLVGLSVHYPKGSGKGEITVTGLEIEVVGGKDPVVIPKSHRVIKFGLFTEEVARVVRPDRPKNLIASIHVNTSKPSWIAYVEYKIRDINGNLVAEVPPKKWGILGGHCFVADLPVPEKYGIYYVEAIVTFPEDPVSNFRQTRSFAYMKPTENKEPYKKGQFKIGIQDLCWWQMDERIDRIRAMELLGVKFTRVFLSVLEYMPAEDIEIFEFAESCVKLMKQHGIETLACVVGNSGWTLRDPSLKKTDPGYMRHMPKEDAWRKFVSKAMKKFKGLVRVYEVWNEPDLPNFASYDVDEYRRLMEIVVEERNKIDPDAIIGCAGFCSFDRKNNFHPRAIHTCKDLMQIHFFHGHGPYEGYRRLIDESLLPLREKEGITNTIPWYAHETGLTTTGFGERRQAIEVYRKILFTWSRGGIGYTWFLLVDRAIRPEDPEMNYGIITADFYPKAAFPAFNALTGIYGGDTVFVKEYTNLRDSQGLLFKKNNDLLLALWYKTEKASSELTFRTDAKQAEYLDIFGNSTKLPIQSGLVVTPVSDLPGTLRLHGATFCDPAQGVVENLDKVATIRTNADSTLRLKVTNPQATRQTIAIELALPVGVTCTNAKQSVSLGAGQSKTLNFTLNGKAFSSYTAGASPTIKAKYSLTAGTAGFVALPVSVISDIEKDFDMARPYAVLNRREQVTEYFDANPADVYRLWKGPQDFEAKVYLAGDDTSLRIKAVVTDDVHIQTQQDPDIWRNDSVQVYVTLPQSSQIWQFGCALNKDGKTQKAVWSAARGMSDTLLKAMQAKVTRSGNTTTYLMTIPWKALKITPAAAREGVKFDILFNEIDHGEVREACIMLAPGAGDQVSSEAYPMFKLK